MGQAMKCQMKVIFVSMVIIGVTNAMTNTTTNTTTNMPSAPTPAPTPAPSSGNGTITAAPTPAPFLAPTPASNGTGNALTAGAPCDASSWKVFLLGFLAMLSSLNIQWVLLFFFV